MRCRQSSGLLAEPTVACAPCPPPQGGGSRALTLPCFLPCSLPLHHRHAPGQPQQLLQPLDLHAVHGAPLPRPDAALPLLLHALPEVTAGVRPERQQEEQLLLPRPQLQEHEPEELHAAVHDLRHRWPGHCAAAVLPPALPCEELGFGQARAFLYK